MYRTSLTSVLGGVIAVTLLAGCGRGMVVAENPAPVDGEGYAAVFEESVRVLRDKGFTVDRQDRRFGVITTRPRTSPSVFEPWHGDNTTGEQVLGSTLNHRRRVIRIEIQSAGAAADGENTTAADRAAQDGPGAGPFQLRVTANVQQRIVPTAELTTAAVRSISLRKPHGPRQLLVTERGEEEAYWKKIGRDSHFERRLVRAILGGSAAPSGAGEDERVEPGERS